MKLLVTGGLGYIGGRFSEYAAAQTGVQLTVTTRRAVPPTAAAHVVLLRPDDTAQLAQLCRGVDVIVHLAGMNAADCARDASAAVAARASAASALLEVAEQQGVPRLIYLSTAHVYGAALTGRVTEDTPPQPTHPYALGHLAAEERVRAARAGIDTAVVRLSNSYGAPATDAPEAWKLVANQLCRDAVRMRRIELKTQGLQRRDFIPLSEVCRALLFLCGAPAGSLAARTFNVGGDDASRILDLAARIAARTQLRLQFEPLIHIGTDRDTVGAGPLEFSSERVRQLGFQPAPGAADAELDRLIEHCAALGSTP